MVYCFSVKTFLTIVYIEILNEEKKILFSHLTMIQNTIYDSIGVKRLIKRPVSLTF